MKRRLHPLDKPGFMESALQKWLAIFLMLGVATLILGGRGPLWADLAKDFLAYLTTIAGLYTAVSGGTDAIRAGRYPLYGGVPTCETEVPLLPTDPHPKASHFDDGSLQ